MIVTQSSQMKDLIGFAQRVARSSAPVLLMGESGTGKELFANLVHQSSARSSRPLVCVNCAALPFQLIESELFGHEKGSFTDAVSTRKGRFEAAGSGSLFLDEVSEIPLTTQAKLLRVLESSEFERVGSSETLRHDVRIIAASNRDLQTRVQSDDFRLDLYHRLNVVQLKIPPLRERREDLPLLAMHFLDQFRHESEHQLIGFTKDALRLMNQYDWPGNVRELRNVVHRSCILTQSDWITDENLDLSIAAEPTEPTEQLAIPEPWLGMELAEIERRVILACLNKYGNQRIVAQTLGVSARTLTNRMRQYRETIESCPAKAA